MATQATPTADVPDVSDPYDLAAAKSLPGQLISTEIVDAARALYQEQIQTSHPLFRSDVADPVRQETDAA